ncbi:MULTISPECIES: BolA family protein [Ignatzschineria]|uniref:BolA family transcriptional regulator n=1 Tax=Ignatzschineria cameli TaxID=2182793 RepID=A0A2U2ATP8_9GAMM|nr:MULTISPECIES: BolA family protein [Ignatzschineria]OYQ78747.1 BolA family transcriptional regulator [Ignatzschineria sp. F8392]PWD87476.1 BolA family transcriptional regulator [Ignatzschineria cameli]PWD88025.1 BolA family transcriptional regulator [Ignatzschineria cameli]PWD91057.1 BolA family transcriptional regulator [Ignatzschineria cameli]PWD92699.1 BolA family transcriptional regulator [Ignatzschineria cameli]
MMTKDKVKALIEAGLKCDYIEVKGDDGVHFEAIIVSPEFEGLSMLKQHKLVYATLGDRLETEEIHALALKTYKPSEWSK